MRPLFLAAALALAMGGIGLGLLVQRPLGRAVLMTLLALTATAAVGFCAFVAFSCWEKDVCQPEMSLATAAWVGLLAVLILLIIAALVQRARRKTTRPHGDEASPRLSGRRSPRKL